MSSPIHHAEDLDEVLHYAPPWAREQGLRERPAAQLVRAPQGRRPLDIGNQAFSGDLAMAKLQRQLALDPDAVPEPPVDNIASLWPMALRRCGVAGVARQSHGSLYRCRARVCCTTTSCTPAFNR